MTATGIKPRFSVKEFSGAMGDFGTLIPLATGYIVVCGLNPAALLIAIGIISILTGLVFRLPVPIKPMKVLKRRYHALKTINAQ